MYLGIEIGGTKLQVAVGPGDKADAIELVRGSVEAAHGARGILDWVAQHARPLIEKYRPRAVGIGFGGPVDARNGHTVKSHHVEGWDDFPLTDWAAHELGLRAAIGNDADLAGLAEARFGAGREARVVFYITIGTGIGGGLIVDGEVFRGAGVHAAEIGHLRPGLRADRPEENLESLAAGWGIASVARARLEEPVTRRIGDWAGGIGACGPEAIRERLVELEEAQETGAADLLRRADHDPARITARLVGEAAAAGNVVALDVLARAWQALGWGVAQVITLVAPEVVVIGGGVSLLGQRLLFEPLAREVERYVFPPARGTYRIVPAELGEEMVLYGALALASRIAERDNERV